MDRSTLSQFLTSQKWAVASTVSRNGQPQAAVIGVAVTEAQELVFDTLTSSRKAQNLRANPRIALVLGGLDGSERTIQYEGVADFPSGTELEELKCVYLNAFPDGSSRESLPEIAYVRVRPNWLRLSDFSTDPPTIVSFEYPESNHRESAGGA